MSVSYEKYFVPSDRQKRNKWMKDILNSITRLYGTQSITDRRWNYQLVQQRIRGAINSSDYNYIWDTWGLPKPMTFINYPLLETHIDGLVGSFLSSNLDYEVWKVNENAISEKMDTKTKMVLMELMEPSIKKVEQHTGVNIPVDRTSNMPPEVMKYKNYDIRDMMEESIFYALYQINHEYNAVSELGNCLNDLCENKFCFGKIMYDRKNPYIKHIPIINAICDLPLTNEPYSDTKNQNILGEDHYMNEEEIIQAFGPKLTDEDLKNLKSDISNITMTGNTSILNDGNQNGYYYYFNRNNNEVYARVTEIQVRAYSQKQFSSRVKQPDDDTPPREETEMREVHCGLRIGKSIYKTWKKPNQIPYKDNYKDLQTDYWGVFTKSSLYDKGWGFQMLYNVINMHIEFQVNQSGGKAVRYNVGAKPENQELDDITYNAKVGGLIIEQPQPGTTGQSSIGSEIDFGLGQGFQYMMAAKKEIESSMGILTGVTPERLGNGNPYQGEGAAQQQMVNASFVTAPIFNAFNQFIQMGMQRQSDLVKYLWADDEWKSVIVGDAGLKVFKMTKDMRNYDYGIMVRNGHSQKGKNDYIQALMDKLVASSQDAPDMALAAIKMANAISGKEKQKVLENAIDFLRDNKKNIENMQNQIQAANVQVAQQKAANDKLRAEAARYTPIDVSQIQKEGSTTDTLLKNYASAQQQLQDHSHERDMALLQGSQPPAGVAEPQEQAPQAGQ